MEHVESGARELHRLLTDLELEVAQGGLAELQSLLERLKSLRENLEFCMFPDSGDWVYWAVANPNNATLGATPLDVGERLAACERSGHGNLLRPKGPPVSGPAGGGGIRDIAMTRISCCTNFV